MLDQFIKMTKEMKNYVGWMYTKYTADLACASGGGPNHCLMTLWLPRTLTQ
jgi:hypothetical protein